MSLHRYRKKRDFNITNEPRGKKTKRGRKPLFVVQLHAASHLHYDFRLEIDGVLKSWAVPKGPSLDPNIKRLAVHVEDHPMEYRTFEGIIPKGQYGAGTVIVWDEGTWSMEDKKKGYHSGSFTFLLKGKKLQGLWKLVQIKSDPKNWLLIKVQDEFAKSIGDITKSKPLSVQSGRSLNEVKEQKLKYWSSETKKIKIIRKKSTLPQLRQKLKKLFERLKVKINKFPKTIYPQLATLVEKPPPDQLWLHEIKFDGYRILSFINDSGVKLITRGQQDWTFKFQEVAQELEKLNLNKTILDGEIVALDGNNKPSFQVLQNALSAHETLKCIYYVFDLLYCEGYDLTQLSILDRKQVLNTILTALNSSIIRFSDHIIGSGEKVFEKSCKMSLEGIISKEIQSTYQQTRTRHWLKVKCINRQEFVVCGFTKPRGSRAYFGSLILGYFENNQLYYAGLVGTGFTVQTLKSLYNELKNKSTTHCPFEEKPRIPNIGSWVEPDLTVEVTFREWTDDGILRHPSFKGLRKDKPAKEISKETAINTALAERYHITHPDKILYPKHQITKNKIAEYYENISTWILPYVATRPLSLVRCPQGIEGTCFYQKHFEKQGKNQDIYKVAIKEKRTTADYIYIKNISGLMQLIQFNVLEIHPWNCKIDKLEKPDIIVFDLDPGSGITWPEIIDAAYILKDELEHYNLTSFVRTTGGKGLHIVIPLKRLYHWEQVLLFTKVFVQYLVQKYPERFIETMTKSKRPGKIFIDYLRNGRGATAIASYSTRAREEALVAVPLSWKELSQITPEQFNLDEVVKRLQKTKDPWASFFYTPQTLPIFK